MRFFLRIGVLLGALLLAPAAFAVEITDTWARATVPGQNVGAAYLTITSPTRMRLVAVKSVLAGRVEIHSTQMGDGVMKMRRIQYLDIPAGEAVSLAPMATHLMLLDLKAPLAAGGQVPLELVFRSKGRKKTVKVAAQVRAITQTAPR
ncbi:MAG: copper chaperone PCu(A)C [Betaproteobacteria bacterium]|nr:copper chaperone PCu(A)C [Betaproteobacteria bacterium]